MGSNMAKPYSKSKKKWMPKNLITNFNYPSSNP